MSEKIKKEPEIIVKKLNSNKAIIKNPITVVKNGNGGSGLNYVILG